jgi:hydroxyacylglutathione hydrolase
MAIPIEDNFEDILGKSQRGIGFGDVQLAERAGVSLSELKSILAGKFDEAVVRKLAPVLNLNADALVVSGKKGWYPEEIALDGLATFTTPFGDMTVNSFIVWDPALKDAVIFDSGADCTAMIEFIEEQKLEPRAILLTHTHGDHIFDLDRLKERLGVLAYVSGAEVIKGAVTFDEGKTFKVGGLMISTRLTSGHSRGGITYIVDGLSRPVAIVGDAIFAGSMGGGMVSYQDALRNNREKILALPDETVLCPGHGPLTTVGEEKVHNPFFA